MDPVLNTDETMGKKLGQVKQYANDHKWEEDVQWLPFQDGKAVLVRFVGDVRVLARHWVETLSGKRFPVWCPKLHEQDEEFSKDRVCPLHDDFDDRAQKMLIGNLIVRPLQERGEHNPVRGYMLPHSCYNEIVNISELIHADPTDAKKGVDLQIKYNAKAAGSGRYSIQRGDTTPLTKEELAYTYTDFDVVAPDFDDEEVRNEYVKIMMTAAARHKYYVIQEQDVPANARDPFKYFRGDPRGKPRTQFPELVSFCNGEEEPRRAKIYEEERPVREARTEKKKAPNDRVHPDPEVELTDDHEYGTVPTCFRDYQATAICTRCTVREPCMENTGDDL